MSTPSTSLAERTSRSGSWPVSRTAGLGPPRPKRPAPCEIGEHTFGIAPHGWGKYRFCLDHHMARIGFSTSRHLPTVRIQPRSEFLHAVGPGAAVATLREMLEPELGQLRLWVNRVDLFADWQGWSLSARRRPPLRLPGRGPSHLRGRRHTDRVRVRVAARPRPCWLVSTTRRPRWRPRTPAGGTRSGASATCTACPCTGSSSSSVARDWSSSTSTRRTRSSAPPATCGPTPPGSG